MTKTKPTKIPKRKLLVPEEADHVVIFTDGACLGNPGPGGYGAILRFQGKERRVSGGEEETTNNRMELMAVIKALESLKRDHPVIVFSDSQYVAKGISEWLPNWKARGWRTADKKPVKNADLWKRLDEVASKYDVEWRWVRGHAGHPGNEKAHQLASREAKKAGPP